MVMVFVKYTCSSMVIDNFYSDVMLLCCWYNGNMCQWQDKMNVDKDSSDSESEEESEDETSKTPQKKVSIYFVLSV